MYEFHAVFSLKSSIQFQVLDALHSLPHLSSSQQVFGFKILIHLSCDFVQSFDGELIIKIVQVYIISHIFISYKVCMRVFVVLACTFD